MSFDNGVWDDMRLLITAKPVGSNNPSLTIFRDGIQNWQFSSSSINELHCVGQLPHSYKEGSDIKLHVHWAHNGGSDNGAVVWQAEYSWGNNNEALPASTTSATAALSVLAVDQYKPQIAAIVTVSGTGKKVSSIFNVRIFRDPANAGDTAAGNSIFLLDADCHFQKDSSGSINDTGKP